MAARASEWAWGALPAGATEALAGWLRWAAGGLVLVGITVLSLVRLEYGGLAAGAVFGVGLYALDPAVPAVLAVVGTLVVARLAGAGTSLSVSDALLFVGALTAFTLVRWDVARRLRQALVVALVFQGATLITVAVHPNRFDGVEWAHDLFLVAGSLVIGWVVVDRDKTRPALTLYVAGCTVMALATAVVAVRSHFVPVSLPYGMDKNYIGNTLAVAILIAHLKPSWSGLRGRWLSVAKYVCALGIVAAQSRQAMVALAGAFVLVMLRDPRVTRRSRILLVALAGLAGVVYYTLANELASHNPFDSINARLDAYAQSIALWQRFPWTGAGMRFWYTGLYTLRIDPPNMEIAALATTGVLGLAATIWLAWGSLRILWRAAPQAGPLGLAAVGYHFMQGQFDIFWVSATGSLPWMIGGMALAVADRASARGRSDPIHAPLGNRTRSARPAGLVLAGEEGGGGHVGSEHGPVGLDGPSDLGS